MWKILNRTKNWNMYDSAEKRKKEKGFLKIRDIKLYILKFLQMYGKWDFFMVFPTHLKYALTRIHYINNYSNSVVNLKSLTYLSFYSV